MANRPKNADSLLFHLDLLKQIPKSRKISAPEIHKNLIEMGYSKDIRTVQRVLKELCEHFDIECDDRNKPYGYRWKERSQGLALPILTAQQSLVLMLAEQQLKHLLPSNIMASMKPFFEQASQMVEHAKDKPEYQWLGKVCSMPSSLPLIPAKVDEKIFTAVSTALFKNQLLNIEYQNQNGKRHKSQVMPLAIAHQGATTYLIVRFDGFDDNRMLALHRIKKAEVSTFTFQRPKDFNLKRYQEEGYLGFSSDGKKIRLKFSIRHYAGFHLTETPLSTDQLILEESAEHYRFQATLADNDMLEWWLRRFGDDIWGIEKEAI